MRKWKRLKREIIYDSKYLKLYQDTIKLPTDEIIDDYTLIQTKDSVMIIPITANGKIVMLKEYKHAIGEYVLTFPAGTMDKNGESVTDAAKRELLEETGYTGEEFKHLGEVWYHPTKLLDKQYYVTAHNVKKTSHTSHETTESIEDVVCLSKNELKDALNEKKIKSLSVIGGITLSKIIENV